MRKDPLDTSIIHISFIVPVYKTEDYLSECLESILSDGSICSEVIVVNDATPKSLSHIKKQFPGVRFVEHETNQGTWQARLTGLRLAQGRYVCFVDSDDYFAQTDFRTLYEKAAQADADMAVFRMVREEDDWSLCRLDDYLEDEYMTALAEKRFRWNLADKLFKTATLKEVVNRLPAVTPNLSMAEDFCLSACFCAFAKHVIKADVQTLYFYRANPHSITNQKAISLATVLKHFADYKAIRELVLEFYRSAKVPHEIIDDVDRLYSDNAVFFYHYLRSCFTLEADFFALIEEKLLQSFNHKAVSEFLVRENADLFVQFKNDWMRNPNQQAMILLQNRSRSSVLPSLLENF